MTRPGVRPCCGGFCECFEWCEVGQLEAALRRRNVLRAVDHPAYAAADVLASAYLDARDADDRARDAADAWRLQGAN